MSFATSGRRATAYKLEDVKRVLGLSLCIVRNYLEDENVPRKERVEIASRFALKSIPDQVALLSVNTNVSLSESRQAMMKDLFTTMSAASGLNYVQASGLTLPSGLNSAHDNTQATGLNSTAPHTIDASVTLDATHTITHTPQAAHTKTQAAPNQIPGQAAPSQEAPRRVLSDPKAPLV